MAIRLLLLPLLVVTQTWAFKSGAPPSMCKDMMPHHSSSPVQTIPSPYAIAVENTCSDDCGVLRVSVSGSQQFVGVMLEGRREVEGEIIGKFDSIPSNIQSLNCNGQVGMSSSTWIFRLFWLFQIPMYFTISIISSYYVTISLQHQE